MPEMRAGESVIEAWQRCAGDLECGSKCIRVILYIVLESDIF
jgi:hypothetical protein